VRIGPLKIGVDGGALYGTAYLREPWGLQSKALYGITDPAYRGALQNTPEQIRNVIRTGHRLGWQMSSHVTGDAGVDVVLDAVEAANADSPIKDRRYTLIHAYFPHEDAVRRAAALGVCVDTQPAWYYKDADAIVTALGEARMKSFIGLADWLRRGVIVSLNTDHMNGLDPDHALNPFNPFLTMATAVTRKTESGQVIGPEERISREDALRMMTINAAYLGFDEKTERLDRSRKAGRSRGALARFPRLSGGRDQKHPCRGDGPGRQSRLRGWRLKMSTSRSSIKPQTLPPPRQT